MLSIHGTLCCIYAKEGETTKLLLVDPGCKEMVFYQIARAIILAPFIAYIKGNIGWSTPETIMIELPIWTDFYWRPLPTPRGASTMNWTQEGNAELASHRDSSELRAPGLGILLSPRGPSLQVYLRFLICQRLPRSILSDQTVWEGGWEAGVLALLSLKPPWKVLLSRSSSCLP